MRVIVTGGNSGVGQATATQLASAGHHVVIACRNVAKGERAATTMTGQVEVHHLDLADLASVRKFADSVKAVDVLVNNAGVLGLPLTRTADGFEAHMGTNHLGHFALTCLLAERIRDRIVVVASSNYALAKLHLDDLNWERRRYSMWSAYGESKLANMLFVQELGRRGFTAYAADPGMVASDITRDGPRWLRWSGEHLAPRIGQRPEDGSRASIQAISTDLPNGTYIAPRGVAHQWGKPKATKLLAKARDPKAARGLWELSAELTGCDLP
ncbi:MAG: retinol dehydrogenase 12 [Mycobacterium sp.]|jgi:NAD(P)-dependent dehydrogenase (short-subunit alcohol dehydrogenase family)|nr:retinol dehydrogenase 12 [Mycobacterium sp.]